MKQRFQKNQRRRGAAMIEYALLIAGVTLVSAAAVSLFGHQTNDLISGVAAVLPGAHADDNAPIVSGKLIETGISDHDGDAGTPDAISLGISDILENSDGSVARLGRNLGTGADNINQLILEVGE